jgi:antitoxin component YwqK of YwqJK toxin-antitoxin module
MRDGKADGYWKNYYKNGLLKIEGNRKNYVLDSIWNFYSDNGKITKAVNYLDGKKNGYTLSYDSNQRISGKEFFINDIKQGNSFWYYPSGKTKQVTPYVKGKPDGYAYEFSEDSIIISIIKYQAGILASIERINRKDTQGKKQGVFKSFHENGTLKDEKIYKDDIIDGYVKTFDKKGNLLITEKFNNGKLINNAPELAKLDVYKDYYDDGTLKYEGGYINELPVEIHYHYKQKSTCYKKNIRLVKNPIYNFTHCLYSIVSVLLAANVSAAWRRHKLHSIERWLVLLPNCLLSLVFYSQIKCFLYDRS